MTLGVYHVKVTVVGIMNLITPRAKRLPTFETTFLCLYLIRTYALNYSEAVLPHNSTAESASQPALREY